MLAFAHIQKTAGTTLNWILRRSFGIRHLDVEPWRPFAGKRYYAVTYSAEDHRYVRRLFPWIASIAGHHVKPHSDLVRVCPDIRYITFVREPVARTASHYQGMVTKMGYRKSCEQWLEEERFHDVQTKHIAGRPDVEEAIRVLRERCVLVGLQERFDESLVLLRERAQNPSLDVRYQPENVAPTTSIARDLVQNARTRELLASVNQLDTELYRRVREELFPEQIQEFGSGFASAVQAFREKRHIRVRTLKAYASPALRKTVLEPLAGFHRRRLKARETAA